MSFLIEIDDVIQNPERAPYSRGRIVMGNFEESFESPTHYWKPTDYRRHWKKALERTAAGLDSGLISAAYQNHEWAAWWWVLYSRDDCALVHQVMLLPDVFPNFSADAPYSSIPPYSRKSEDGLISEWVVPTLDIVEFLKIV